MEVITLQEVRLNGQEVPAGEKVSIPGDLVNDWLRLGLARRPEEYVQNADAERQVLYEEMPGGRYRLADGTIVKGKAALKAALKAGEQNGTQGDNPAGG